MIKVAIAGGTGFVAGETLRILLHHPDVEIISVLSTSSAGEEVTSVHTDLIGETNLRFSNTLGNPDALFLCLGHGLSREFIDTQDIPPTCRIIDLGNDFRICSDYKGRHFTYGLTDSFKEEIARSASNIANPGCFATAIQTALLPLVKEGMVREEVNITGITGATGAGKKGTPTNLFSYRENNLSIYKLFKHQHIEEIRHTAKRLGGESIPQIKFVPIRGDFTRGIFISLYTKWPVSSNDIENTRTARGIFEEYYSDSPFTYLSMTPVSLKEVINTNKALLNVEVIDDTVHVTVVIDNLIKGAAGEAIENMNLLFGLPQERGLKLKPSAF